jgi:enterochelin esterase-like enzyme
MPGHRLRARFTALALTGLTALGVVCTAVLGDSVVLKNGIVYRGAIDKDKPLLWVYDGLKRVVLRDSKVARIESDTSYRNLEVFKIEQPLVVHAGSMPREVVSVKASPWNDRGRRDFAYEGARLGKFSKMEQAIIEMGPRMVKIRGVDGFWQGTLATSQVPREVIMAILAKVERKDKNERTRVARFLIQAEWYAEARAELAQILKDFPDDPDLRERVAAARASVVQLEAVLTKASIDRCRLAQQPREASALLKGFPTKEVTADLFAQVGELERNDEAQTAADKGLADDLRALAKSLPKSIQTPWQKPVDEVLKALKEAPDAVRDRFVAWQKARLENAKPPEAMFALALSGYVVGADAAVEDLAKATTLWTVRDQVRQYLDSREPEARAGLLEKLDASLPADPSQPVDVKRLDTVTRLAVRMPPPRDKEGTTAANAPKIHRVSDDDSASPTEYAVSLPPEYHPLRSYPAVVALHDGGDRGPQGAIAWWSAEAARRGYIVIAPEYRLPGQEKEYLYTASEHGAVELALRDAKRRYAIDSDRVFLGGQLVGANMAWDFGLAHPDLFAGVAVVSGLPFKYVNRYLVNAEQRLPLYVVLGDLAPAANEVVYGQILKPLIAKAWDVTYLEYFRRGLEDFPEEAPAIFDWMDRRRRDPYPKSFEVVSARPSDNRFYGVVLRDFKPGRTTAPEAVDPFGKNLNPASIKMKSSTLSNLLNLETVGLNKLDVWVSPKMIDFKKRIEVRINKTPFYKRLAKLDLEPLLEDLRIRGDRQQIYWMKVSTSRDE